MRRIEYLKSYRAYREERAENIRNTQALLQSKIDGLKVTRAEKDDVLKKQSKEQQTAGGREEGEGCGGSVSCSRRRRN